MNYRFEKIIVFQKKTTQFIVNRENLNPLNAIFVFDRRIYKSLYLKCGKF